MSDYLYLIPIVVAVLWAGWMLLLIRDARQPKVNDASLQDDRRRLRDHLAEPPASQPGSKQIRLPQQTLAPLVWTDPIKNPFNPNAYSHASPQAADPLPDPMLLTAVDRPGWEPPSAWSEAPAATPDPSPSDATTTYDPGPASDGSLY